MPDQFKNLDKIRIWGFGEQTKFMQYKYFSIVIFSVVLQDPTSFVGWMNILFTLADAGMTSFDVSAQGWPHCEMKKLFSALDARGLLGGTEKLLGTFKKR